MPYLRPFVALCPHPSPRGRRIQELDRAGHNPFNIPADMVSLDLLSDSGTGAVSIDQQAWAQRADERYAGAESFYRFREAVRDIVPYRNILPVHQGRAAERVLFSALLGPGKISISNTHFDTTRANVERLGAQALDLPCPEASDLDSEEPFKGNRPGGVEERPPDRMGTRSADPAHRHQQRRRWPTGLDRQHRSGQCHRPVPRRSADPGRRAVRRNAWLVTAENPVTRTGRRGTSLGELPTGRRCDSQSEEGRALPKARSSDYDSNSQTGARSTSSPPGFRTYGGLTRHTLKSWPGREVLDPHYLATASEASFLAECARAGVSTVQPPACAGSTSTPGGCCRPGPEQFPGHALACAVPGRRHPLLGTRLAVPGELNEHSN